jgi:SAM-dependent methyltransferase
LKYDNANYGALNVDWHSADSFYKFNKIYRMLELFCCSLTKDKITILDVGSGVGIIGQLFCNFFQSKGVEVVYDTVEPNSDLVTYYKKRNNAFRKNYSSWELVDDYYDICMCFDVVEHIHDDKAFLQKLAECSKHGFFNIPVELNLVDWLRSFYIRDYYKLQEQTLGHVHFYGINKIKSLLGVCASQLSTEFHPYSELVLLVGSKDHIQQLNSRLRKLELYISKWIHALFPIVSPYIIQGSVYSLIRFKPSE